MREARATAPMVTPAIALGVRVLEEEDVFDSEEVGGGDPVLLVAAREEEVEVAEGMVEEELLDEAPL